jgi:hypothetical protein
MGRMLAVGLVIAAIVGAIAGFAGGYLARPSASAPQTRVFYLFSGVMGAPFDEDAVGLFPDIWIPDNIVVNRGDTITIHVYNTENATEVPTEHHTFTMGAPYARNDDLDAGETMTITIVANNAGIFQWQCTFHPPTMVGWLIVLG